MMHLCSAIMPFYGGTKSAKITIVQGNWNDFCCAVRNQFRVENLSHKERDELASMYQYGKESIADFLYRFRATCLKVDNLSEAEKLDRFVHALVPDVRMQVELRGPSTFHEAAMYAERADAVFHASLATMDGNLGKRSKRVIFSSALLHQHQK